MTLNLEPVPDLLAELAAAGGNTDCPVLAFALEYGDDWQARAARKMKRKGAVAVYVNRGDVAGGGMENCGNLGTLLFDDGSSLEIPRSSKRLVAEILAAAMGRYLHRAGDEA